MIDLFTALQDKEAELLQINKLLADSDLTVSKYRQWKEHHEELVQGIDRMASLKASEEGDNMNVQDTTTKEVALETATAENEGAYRMNLSDGEQLVDAEPSDVLLEMASPSTDTSPLFELSLGSLQDSVNKELSERAESADAAENYFYI